MRIEYEQNHNFERRINREIIKNACRDLGNSHNIIKIKLKHQVTTTTAATNSNRSM